MTPHARALLNHLRKLTDKSEAEMCFVSGDTVIALTDSDKFYNYEKYSGEIRGLVKHLIEQGYLENTFNEYHFCLTQKGINPFWFSYERIRDFLFSSILVPIFVAALTSLITCIIVGP